MARVQQCIAERSVIAGAVQQQSRTFGAGAAPHRLAFPQQGTLPMRTFRWQGGQRRGNSFSGRHSIASANGRQWRRGRIHCDQRTSREIVPPYEEMHDAGPLSAR
jgi:hypothetical protein